MNYRAIWQEGDEADNLVDELLTLLLLVWKLPSVHSLKSSRSRGDLWSNASEQKTNIFAFCLDIMHSFRKMLFLLSFAPLKIGATWPGPRVRPPKEFVVLILTSHLMDTLSSNKSRGRLCGQALYLLINHLPIDGKSGTDENIFSERSFSQPTPPFILKANVSDVETKTNWNRKK